jgi:hypothetical protein
MKQQVAALRIGLIERAAEREAIEHLSPHAVMQSQDADTPKWSGRSA